MGIEEIRGTLVQLHLEYEKINQDMQDDSSNKFNNSLHERVTLLSQSITELTQQLHPNFKQNIQLMERIDDLTTKIKSLNTLFQAPEASSSASQMRLSDKISNSIQKRLAPGIFQISCLSQYALNKGKVTCGFHSLKNALCALAFYKDYSLNSQLNPFNDKDIYKHLEKLVIKLRPKSILGDATEVQLRDAWNAIVANQESPFPNFDSLLKWDQEDLSIFHAGKEGLVTTDPMSLSALINLKTFKEKNGPCIHAVIVGSEGHWMTILCEKDEMNQLTYYGLDSADNQIDQIEKNTKYIRQAMDDIDMMAPKLYFDTIGDTIAHRCGLIGPDFQLIDSSEENQRVFISEKGTLLPLLSTAADFISKMGWTEHQEPSYIGRFIDNVLTIVQYYKVQGISDPLIDQIEANLSKAIHQEHKQLSKDEMYVAYLELQCSDSPNLILALAELLKLNKEQFDEIDPKLILDFLRCYPENDRLMVLKNIMTLIKEGHYDYFESVIVPDNEAISQENWILLKDLIVLNLLPFLNREDMKTIFSCSKEVRQSVLGNMLGNLTLDQTTTIYYSYRRSEIEPQLAMTLIKYQSMFSFMGYSYFDSLDHACIALCKYVEDSFRGSITVPQDQIKDIVGYINDYVYKKTKISLTYDRSNHINVLINDQLAIKYDHPILKELFGILKPYLDIKLIKGPNFIPGQIHFITDLDLWDNIKTLELKSTHLYFYHNGAIKGLDVPLEKFSQLNTLEIESHEIIVNWLQEINKLVHLKNLTFLNFMNPIPLDLLEHVEKLTIKNAGDDIPSIPPNLKYLQIENSQCMNLTPIFSSALPQLKILNITNCPYVLTLDNIPDAVESLVLRNNTRLKTISAFPSNLETVTIENCGIKNLPEMPHSVTELYLNDCSKLHRIANLSSNIKKIEILYCDALSLKAKLIVMNFLINHNFEIAKEQIWGLDIEDTSSLERRIAEKDLLFYLENVVYFHPPYEQCRLDLLKTMIKKVKDFKTALVYAPRFGIKDKQKLNKLMMEIDEIKDIFQRYPFLDPSIMDSSFMWTLFRAIENHDEDALLDLLKLPTAVEEFSQVKDIPQVREFITHHIYSIFNHFDALRNLEKIYSPEIEENDNLYPFNPLIKSHKHLLYIFSKLQHPYQHPVQVLTGLGNLFSIKGSTVNKLKLHFYGHEGYDEGGLGRQFIYSLFDGLLHNPSSELQFVTRKNGKCVPILKRKMSISKDEIEAFESIGRLFAFLLSSKKNYPFGEIFDDEFFEIIKSFRSFEIDMSSEDFQKRLDEMPQEDMFWTSLIDEESDLNKIKAILYSGTIEDLTPDLIDYIKKILWIDEISSTDFDKIKEEFFSDIKGVYMSTYIALHAIARGIFKSMPFNAYLEDKESAQICENWNDFSFATQRQIINLSYLLQGELSKEQFIDAIKVGPKDHEKKDTVNTWINEWIENAEIDDVRLLLIQLTGAPSVSSKIKLSIRGDNIFEYQTCFNQMIVPTNIEKERFMRELDKVVLELKQSEPGTSGYGFNIQ